MGDTEDAAAVYDRVSARAASLGVAIAPEELAERDALRREYIDAHRESLISHLENTYIQYPDGTRKKLQRKGPGTR